MRRRGGRVGRFFVGEKAVGEAFAEEDGEIGTPGSPPEPLLEVVRCRRSDGREASLAELPPAGLLEGAAAMPAEEVELSVGGGRARRADFLTMVSREPRAPLASVKGSAGTVLDASPKASRAEMPWSFRPITGQAGHMRVLIANLLDAGGIEAGTLAVAPRARRSAARPAARDGRP